MIAEPTQETQDFPMFIDYESHEFKNLVLEKRSNHPTGANAYHGRVYTLNGEAVILLGDQIIPFAKPTVEYEVDYTPPTLDNRQSDVEDIQIEGLVHGKFYAYAITPSLAAFPQVVLSTLVVANDTLRISIENKSGQDNVSLPTLTFKIKEI